MTGPTIIDTTMIDRMDAAPADAVRLIETPIVVDLKMTCAPLRGIVGDPTWSIRADGVVRAMHTPDGPTTVAIRRDARGFDVRSFGPGASWIVERAHLLLGLQDRADGFDPSLHPVVARIARRRGGARFGAGLSVSDLIVPIVIGQRVTVGEANRSWWRLVRRYGAVAPGPFGLRLAPDPRVLCRLGVADWHVLGVERRRADTIRRCLGVLAALERSATAALVDERSDELQRVLQTIPGVGPWTATGMAIGVLGDPDVVLLGDLHVPHSVCHALAGEERGSDARMLELLAPFAGHRGRVVRMLKGSVAAPPRRAPRYNPIPIERW